MESINKDLLFEIAKYLTSYQLRDLFFAFPELINRKIHFDKVNLEDLLNSRYGYSSTFSFDRMIYDPDIFFLFHDYSETKNSISLDHRLVSRILFSAIYRSHNEFIPELPKKIILNNPELFMKNVIKQKELLWPQDLSFYLKWNSADEIWLKFEDQLLHINAYRGFLSKIIFKEFIILFILSAKDRQIDLLTLISNEPDLEDLFDLLSGIFLTD